MPPRHVIIRRLLAGPFVFSVMLTGLGAGGAVLSVAQRTKGATASVLLWGVAVLGIFLAIYTLWNAVLLAGLASRSLARISTPLERVADGDLSVRLPEDTSWPLVDRTSRMVNQALERLQRRDVEMRSALNTIAHEMRTPLSHVVQHLAVFNDPEATPEERQSALEGVSERIDFVRRSYDSILRLAHIETGAAEPHISVDLSTEAANVAAAFDAAFEDEDRRIVANCAPAWAVVDANLIAIAVSTLLENVLAHTPRGVCATVSTWTAEGYSFLQVRDNGPGLSAEDMKHAVERFQRGAKSRGLGLGLTVVEAIARRAGASLTLADADPGLSVTLRFETAAPDAAAS